MEKFIADHFPRITELAAIAAYRAGVGRGDKNAADQAAVTALRDNLNKLDFRGRIVIGEGERDEAPMLFIGEQVGTGQSGHEIDIAVDPLENTNATAYDRHGAICVMAASEKGGLFHAPDIYINKLIVGAEAAGRVNLDWSPRKNLENIADSLHRNIEDLKIVILRRDRNAKLIEQVRKCNAQIRLIEDGDLMPGIAACLRGSGIHAVMGIGAAPEGVITSAGVKCLKGEFQGRFWFAKDEDKNRFIQMGGDIEKIYSQDDLASGQNLVFCATGVTDGEILNGVHIFDGGVKTQTLVLTNDVPEVSMITRVHVVDKKKIEFRIPGPGKL